MSSNKFALERIPVLLISLAIFLCGALALTVPSGYTYGPAVLFLFALVYVWVRPYPQLNANDKILAAAFFIYFISGVLTNSVHHLPANAYDNFSRFLLAIPVLLLLLRFPVKPVFFWSGIAVGALGAAVIAVIDFYWRGHDRAGGHNNPIQFGDIAILFSCLLLVGFSRVKTYSIAVTLLFLVGISSGIFASLLSGSRGGWLAWPFAFGIFYINNNFHKNSRQLWIGVVLLLALVAIIYQFQQSVFEQMRIHEAVEDLQQYSDAQNSNSSLGIRLTLWHSGIHLIAQHPWLGWGSVANYVNITGDSSYVFQHFNHFHNEFLDATVKRGVLGFVALIIIYGVPGWLFYRELKHCPLQSKPLVLAGCMLVLATFIFGLTQSFLSHSSGVMVYAFMVVILWAQARQQPRVNKM